MPALANGIGIFGRPHRSGPNVTRTYDSRNARTADDEIALGRRENLVFAADADIRRWQQLGAAVPQDDLAR